MAEKTPPKELLEAVTEPTMAVLRDITSLYVSKYASDPSAACRNGAVLLGIAKVDNDPEGKGFRFLIGLDRRTEPTPYLANYFSGHVMVRD